MAVVALVPVWLLVAGAYVFAASSVSTEVGPAAAALAALAIAASGILYAWREPAPAER